jgi:predicted transcriptional regulator
VSLYEKYKGRVQFVIIDLDKPKSAAQQKLVGKYYKGYIPHVTVLDPSGNLAYNEPGEVSESEISRILDGLLNRTSK